jgi:hypothetical protein
MRCAYKISVGKPAGKRDLGVDGILRKYGMRM